MKKLLFSLLLICSTLNILAKSIEEITACHCADCMRIKIGQMIMTSMPDSTALSPRTIEMVKRYKIGGILLFEDNLAITDSEPNLLAAQQAAARHREMQALSGDIPMFITIDHEGSTVNRLRSVDGFSSGVTARYLGVQDSEDTTRFWVDDYARTLKGIGVNLNYAPTVDLMLEKNMLFEKERCFSADPQQVIRHAQWWVSQSAKHGILSVIKHFPGHGSSLADSHLGLTEITNSWSEKELIPYQKMVAEGYLDMIMIGHLYHAKLDSIYPASLSKSVIQGMLRDKIGFDGVVITDALNMGAITQNYTLEQALIQSINAGTDILMVVLGKRVSIEQTFEIIEKAIADGTVPVARIDESFGRIMKLKQRLNI